MDMKTNESHIAGGSIHFWPLAVLCLAMALSGCGSVLLSKPLADGDAGLYYGLPKAQVQLVAQRKLVDAKEVDEAKKSLADAKAALEASKAKLAEAKATYQAADAKATLAKDAAAKKDASEGDRAALAELDKQRAIAKILADLQDADATKKAKEVAAADAVAKQLVGHVGKWVETVELSVLPHVPDPAARYVIQHQESAGRDDQFTLEVKGGLLSTSASESTGQAATIVLNLVRSIAGLRAGTGGVRSNLMFSLPRFDAAGKKQCKAYAMTLLFDPTNASEREQVRVVLKDQGLTLGLLPEPASVGTQASGSANSAKDGLLYRPMIPVTLKVSADATDVNRKVCGETDDISSTQLTALLPDSTHTLVLPVHGVAFGKGAVKYTFKDGIPSSMDVSRPSQLAALAGLPVDILKALISVPTEFIKLRVDYSSQAAALTSAQTKELTSLKELLDAQKALEDAKVPPSNP